MQGFGKRQIYLLFFFFGFLIIIINFVVSYYQMGKEIEKDFINDSKKTLLFDKLSIKNRIEHYEKELKVLSESEQSSSIINRYLDDPTHSVQVDNTYLIDLAKSHPSMMQLRYICNHGNELIRIDRKELGAEPVQLPSNKLQNKKKRYYFEEISQLNDGDIWYSDLDLNIEHGKIQVPYQPTLRIGTPVFVEGERRGMVIINIFMEDILKQLQVAESYQSYLIDSEGNFLLHPNPEYNWSKYLGKEHTFEEEFSRLKISDMKRGYFDSKELFIEKFELGHLNQYYLIAKLNTNLIDQEKNNLIKTFALISFLVMVIALPFALIIVYNIEHLSARLAAIIDSLGDGIFILDKEKKATYINSKTTSLLGYSAHEVLGKNTHSLLQHSDEGGNYIEDKHCPIYNVNETKQQYSSGDNTFVTKSGKRINVEYTTTPFFVNNKFEGSITLFRDITERKTAEQEIKRLSRVVEQIDDIVTITDPEGVITYVNEAFSRHTGYMKGEVLGKTPRVYKSGKHPASEIEELWNTILEGRVYRGIIINRRKGDGLFYEEKTITPLLDEKGNIISFVSTGKDITHRIEMEIELEKLASTDYLTGIYNRYKFEEFLDAELTRCQRYGKALSLIMFDIDYFKKINDTYGHDAGDTVLKEISNLVKSHIRQSDVLARWGGEEFMLLTPEVDLESAYLLAEKLRKAVDEFKFTIVGHVTCSIGVTQLGPDDNCTQLCQRVDNALYEAKEKGRNRTVKG
ncbi:GGDEF domain-containing protein [Campylobacterota bacterium]